MAKEVEKVENVEVLDCEVVNNPNEIKLSTGKVITLRERKGQHHIIENRLLSACAVSNTNGGINIGDLILASEIKTIIAIEYINGKKVKIPSTIGEAYELTNDFTYDEWDELKLAIQPKKEVIEQAAKNLQTSAGLDNV